MTKADVIFKENIKKLWKKVSFQKMLALFTKAVDKLIQNTLRSVC